MARRPAPNLVKTHRIYTVWEAADALGCHRQTVIRWIRNNGLPSDTSQRPWLIRGSDLKVFLGERRAKRRCQLSPHHLFCLGCKESREPDGKIADYTQQTDKTGMLKALCPICGNLMNKVIRRADLEVIRAKIDVTIQQASARLMSRTDPPLNVTLNIEEHTHAKVQQR